MQSSTGLCSDVRQSVMLLIYFVTGSLIICWALWSCDCDYRLGFVVVWLAVWQSDILAMLGFVVVWLAV